VKNEITGDFEKKIGDMGRGGDIMCEVGGQKTG